MKIPTAILKQSVISSLTWGLLATALYGLCVVVLMGGSPFMLAWFYGGWAVGTGVGAGISYLRQ